MSCENVLTFTCFVFANRFSRYACVHRLRMGSNKEPSKAIFVCLLAGEDAAFNDSPMLKTNQFVALFLN